MRVRERVRVRVRVRVGVGVEGWGEGEWVGFRFKGRRGSRGRGGSKAFDHRPLFPFRTYTT